MRPYMFASLSSIFATAVLVLACGASPPAGAAAPSNGSASTAPAAPAPPSAPSATTTTTLTLGDGGDLNGAKLATTTSTAAPTVDSKSDAGAKPHAHEAGRGVKDIQAIILARRDEARACYDNELKVNPGIEGDVDMTWIIDPKGDATEVGVDEGKSSIHDDKVWKCIAAIIQKIKFAPSAKGFQTKTHYPFNFHPRTTVGGGGDAGPR